MDERVTRYERDGGVTLIDGARAETIDPGWTNATIDAAAEDFFGHDDESGAA